ncbi:MAG: cation:proton antiporter [Methanobacteriota archaeon]
MEPLLLQMGFVILLAFGGAAIAHRFGQSMMLAYIIVGVLIGPFGPLPWKLVSASELDGGFISVIGQMGLVMLMFFVGLEFYPSKIKEIGHQAALLAAADIGATMMVGLSVCAWFGMTLMDSVFISSIVAMSSVAVTMKVLDELGWQGSKASQALIGMMVIEDFAFIILITAGKGIIMGPAAGDADLVWTFGGIAVFLTFFLVLILVFVPSVLSHIERVKHEEAFVLLALSTIFLSGALAEAFGLSAFVGAFFMGVAFAETNLARRLKEKTVSFRDAFAAIFFVTFGMMIDPGGIIEAVPLLLAIIPAIILAEVGIVAATAYLAGHTPEDSMTIAGGTTARSEEAVIFASMGGKLETPTGEYVLSPKVQPVIYPFTGAFCFIMSATTPLLIKNSKSIAAVLKNAMPCWLGRSGTVLQGAVSALTGAGGGERRAASWAFRFWLAVTMLSLALAPTLSMATSGSEPEYAYLWVALLALAAAATTALWWAMKMALAGALPRRDASFSAGALAIILSVVPAVALAWPSSYVLALSATGVAFAVLMVGCAAFGRGTGADFGSSQCQET